MQIILDHHLILGIDIEYSLIVLGVYCKITEQLTKLPAHEYVRICVSGKFWKPFWEANFYFFFFLFCHFLKKDGEKRPVNVDKASGGPEENFGSSFCLISPGKLVKFNL